MKFHNYYVYITTNPQKTTLYTGVTNDLGRRMSEHLADCNTAKRIFAGKYHCHNLVYYEYFSHIDWAIAREKQIKKWRREKKNVLISYFNPDWRFLNDEREIAKGDLPIWTLDMEDKRPY